MCVCGSVYVCVWYVCVVCVCVCMLVCGLYGIKCAPTLTVAYCAPCAVPVHIISMPQLSRCPSHSLKSFCFLSLSLAFILRISLSLGRPKTSLLMLYIICYMHDILIEMTILFKEFFRVGITYNLFPYDRRVL